MDRLQMIDLYNQDQRIQIEYPDMQREVTSPVLRRFDYSEIASILKHRLRGSLYRFLLLPACDQPVDGDDNQ